MLQAQPPITQTPTDSCSIVLLLNHHTANLGQPSHLRGPWLGHLPLIAFRKIPGGWNLNCLLFLVCAEVWNCSLLCVFPLLNITTKNTARTKNATTWNLIVSIKFCFYTNAVLMLCLGRLSWALLWNEVIGVVLDMYMPWICLLSSTGAPRSLLRSIFFFFPKMKAVVWLFWLTILDWRFKSLLGQQLLQLLVFLQLVFLKA